MVKKILNIVTHKGFFFALLILTTIILGIQSRQVFLTNLKIDKFLRIASKSQTHYINEFGVEYLDSRIVHELYQMFKDVTELLDAHEIKYWATSGTLIGAIRHKGFIPWDDDIDIAIPKTEIDKLLSLQPQLKNLRYILDVSSDSTFIKIYPETGLSLPDGFRYPFIDIFAMHQVGEEYIHAGDKARETWPNERFSISDIQTLKRCTFGDIQIWCPGNPQSTLKALYGENVMIEGVYYGSHYVSTTTPIMTRWTLRPWEFAPSKSGKLMDRVSKEN